MSNFSSHQNEKQASSNLARVVPVQRRLSPKVDLGLKGLTLAAIVTLIAGSLYLNFRPKKQKDDTTDTTQSTNATQPTSTDLTNPPRAIARRKERFLDRDFPVDVSGEPTPSLVQSVADYVDTNTGSLEDGSFLDNTR